MQLDTSYEEYCEKHTGEKTADAKNKAQQRLREAFDPFFAGAHAGLKQLDKTVRQHEKHQAEAAQKDGRRTSIDRKTKALKTALEALHGEVKDAEIFYHHIRWLQARFPKAEYEDITGLCKLACLADMREQEYSLNPGRYVGVVAEEDGLTEEEHQEKILRLHDEFAELNQQACALVEVIAENIRVLIDS